MSPLPLTDPNPELSRQQRNTYDGMAHWAGSGPPNKTCRQCREWANAGDYYVGRKTLKNAFCRRYRRMTQATVGGKIPHSAKACKYFEENETPPPIKARGAL